MEFKVKCDKCGKGNLCLPNGYDGLADYYEVHCTKCSNVFEVHYTGMDCILGAHEFNCQVSEDVRILENNGSWVCDTQSIKIGEFDKHTKGMELIQEIDADFTYYYFRSGADFCMIRVACHGYDFDIFKYKAKSDESVMVLLKHFFSLV
ncbi:hypothetical protein PQE75_gp065 [Bacillus phage vB_BcoS-136]|uniref:Uncharacterized protein n=1 Tax=Bacillus phage vB_BcoS-136 TaxID=2419619 RepID=A0A3G3BVC4_9CAUD|nr:hypothetical protein PQE75_gp065 [Bacillus phage vB_BcoS-136]AYP68197.1 hypothetical protein vBBcoS136_00065 [Bacillus phage vB_BcoS-136]